MVVLPTVPFFNSSPRPKWSEAKPALDDLITWLEQLVDGSSMAGLTIAGDAITPTEGAGRYIEIDTESAAVTDDLKNIVPTNVPDGGIVILHIANAGRTVVVKNAAGGPGEITLAEGIDVLLDSTKQHLVLRLVGTAFVELDRFLLPLRDTVVAKTAAYTVTIHDQGRTFTNEGATSIVVFTLPTAVAGQRYRFVVTDADGIRITAGAGDTIRRTTSVTAAAGSIESTAIGSVVELLAVDATQWIALDGGIGTWT